MLTNLGNLFLIFSIISGFFIVIYPFIVKNFSTSFYKYLLVSFNLSIISAFIILLYLFLSKDFRVISVLMNISSLMEAKYIIAASWSSHETSLLFWCFITSCLTMIFYFQTDFKEAISYSVNSFIQICFLICLYLGANPFRAITSTPGEGLGMNPSLQDIGIMIHPPLLYVSYGIFQIIYSMNIASLFTGNVPAIIANWSRCALSILLGAIALGGWWAYRELGWGGYWFFDPVENISLLILVFAISYHHSLLQKNFELTKVIFGILPFLSALIGTFFVRSGLLISVHSFAESPSSSLLLTTSILILIFSFIAIGYFFKGKMDLPEYSSKHYFIQGGNLLWSISGIIIILSIIFPVIYSIIFAEVIEVQSGFFIKTLLPIMLVSSLLSGLIYFNRNLGRLLAVLICNLAILFIAIFIMKASLIQAFSYFVASIIISSSIIRAIEKWSSLTLNIASISMLLGHAAIGILIASICFNKQYGFSENVIVKLQESTKFRNEFTILLTDVNYTNGKNYIKQEANIRIMLRGNEIAKINPELRFYPIEKTLSSEVGIYNSLFADWYGVLNNIKDNQASLQIFYHPAISLIWFSIFLAIFAILLGVRKR